MCVQAGNSRHSGEKALSLPDYRHVRCGDHGTGRGPGVPPSRRQSLWVDAGLYSVRDVPGVLHKSGYTGIRCAITRPPLPGTGRHIGTNGRQSCTATDLRGLPNGARDCAPQRPTDLRRLSCTTQRHGCEYLWFGTHYSCSSGVNNLCVCVSVCVPACSC